MSVRAQLVSTGFLRCFQHFRIILALHNRCQNISMFISENLNPLNKRTDDCVVRALAKALGIDWKSAYTMLSAHGLKMADMFSKNYVWGDLLLSLGFTRSGIPNTCPDCYTIAEFATDHPVGTYIIGTGDHAVAVINGDWFDSFDSGSMIPIICYRRE